jgi:hypothetical protein
LREVKAEEEVSRKEPPSDKNRRGHERATEPSEIVAT